MGNFLSNLLSPSQYIPHGHCYLWQTPLVALHLISDALIAIAYFSIPALLVYFIQKRRDVPFSGVFALFGAFIVLCGLGHLLDIWTLWHPAYWLSGSERALTALVSCMTALQLVTLLPQFLALKTPEQLEVVNRELQQEIVERKRIEIERNRAYEELELRVQERTADLEQANIALQEREALLHRLAANVPGMLYQYKQGADGYSSIVYASEACRTLYELEPEEMLDKYLAVIHPDDRQRRANLLIQSAQTLQRLEAEWRIITTSGIKWIRAISQPRCEPDGSIIWDGVQADISDRKQTEAALQQALKATEYQSRLVRTVLDSTQDCVFAKDKEFRYILVNRSYTEMLGRPTDEILGKDDLELGFSMELVFGNPEKGIRGFRTDDQAALMGALVHNPYDPATLADGSLRIWDARKTPLYDSDGNIFAVFGITRDITERHYADEALRRSEIQLKEKAEELEQALRELQRTQTQMIQAEKMSGLGQLVAGIAHEINNPVNFIHGNLQPAWEYTQDLLKLLHLYQTQVLDHNPEISALTEEIDLEFLKDDLPKLLASMKMGTDRIREIVLSLRNFSRLDEDGMKAVDLHEGINNTLVILGNRLKAKADQPGIEIITQYGSIPFVECYAGQLNQVFMNILSNAIDAIESHNQKRTLQDIRENPSQITIATSVIDAKQVQIRIADNGTGMTEIVQQKLFDPFFTTKPVGTGTGMGLAICYQIIVDRHQGTVSVNSTPGQGTEFVITLSLKGNAVPS